MKLSTLVQLALVTLLIGVGLGAVFQHWSQFGILSAAAVPTTAPVVVADAPPTNRGVLPQGELGSSTLEPGIQVQVRAEVHAVGNAQAQAQALGPGDTQAKANTNGPGDAQAAAFSTEPNSSPGALTQSQSAQTGANLSGASASAVGTSAQSTRPRLIVLENLVNVRDGPGGGYTVLGQMPRGAEFTTLARTNDYGWWKVCCYNNQPGWVSAQVATVIGPITGLEVVQAPPAQALLLPTPTVASSPTPAPMETPPTTATPTAIPYPFDLVEQKQFAETVTPRIFLYVSDGSEGLAGYTLRIRKDNVDLPVNVRSFYGPPGYTWPLPIDRQRFHNMKIEFPYLNVVGNWEVQLVDSSGNLVGPPAFFQLKERDANQELYLHYRRRL
jgi:uncharacterized protein YraI